MSTDTTTTTPADGDGAVTLSLPGTVAEFLSELGLSADERAAYDAGEARHHGRGWSLKVTARLDVHAAMLERCWVLAGGDGVESSASERAAYRIYSKRIDAARAAQTSGAQTATS